MAVKEFLVASAVAVNTVYGATLPAHARRQATEPTCSEKAQGTEFAFTTAGNTYDVTCGADYFGGDLRSLQADSFGSCLTACDTEAACVTVAYTSGVCYLKQEATPSSANAGVWAAKKKTIGVTKAALSCNEQASDGKIYQSAKGSQFKVICGKEYFGGDLAATNTATFEACVETCDTTAKCVDVSYVNGACYLKQSTGSLVDAGHVWTAQLVDGKPSTTGTTPKTETPSKTKALSCIGDVDNGKTYTAKTGGAYTIECGIDHFGGDMKSLDGTTFETCMDACDAETGCVDVSFVNGACYLKGTLNEGVAVGHVWTGRLTNIPESEPPTPMVTAPSSPVMTPTAPSSPVMAPTAPSSPVMTPTAPSSPVMTPTAPSSPEMTVTAPSSPEAFLEERNLESIDDFMLEP